MLRYGAVLAAVVVGALGCGDDKTIQPFPPGTGVTGTGTGTGGTDTGGTGTGEDTSPTCEVIHGIGCGSTINGNTNGGPQKISSYACTSGVDYKGSAENTYSLTVEKDTELTLKVNPPGALDVIAMRPRSDGTCNPNDCLSAKSGDKGAKFKMKKGEKRFVTVERRDQKSGDYTLEVVCCEKSCKNSQGLNKICGDDGCGGTCGAPCPNGTACNEEGQCAKQECVPLTSLQCGQGVDSVPLSGTGSTKDLTKYSCNPTTYAGPEVAYSFFAQSDQEVSVKLTTSQPENPIDLLLLKGDNTGKCSSSQCVGFNNKEVVFPAKSGEQYYLVVDAPVNTDPLFSLAVDCCVANCGGAGGRGPKKVCGDNGCNGTCGTCDNGTTCNDGGQCVTPGTTNDTCAKATVIDSLPFTGAGTTEGAKDDYAMSATCPDDATGGKDGNDVVYTFTAQQDQLVRLTMTPQDKPDECPPTPCPPNIVYVTLGCPSSGGEICIGNGDFFLDETKVEWTAQKGSTYYITIDGFNQNEVGAYQINLIAP